MEEILKVKAAFSLAFECLLDAAGLESRDVARVYLGGALGEYASGEALETLGFLPPGLRSRVTAAGNTSLRVGLRFCCAVPNCGNASCAGAVIAR
ncbi:MAG: ASKHA domain-containing protein [Bilophila sp.]